MRFVGARLNADRTGISAVHRVARRKLGITEQIYDSLGQNYKRNLVGGDISPEAATPTVI
jgi:hypothetical protein